MIFKLSDSSTLTVKPFDSISEVAKVLTTSLTKRSVALSGGSTYDKLFDAWRELKVDLSDSWYIAVDERAVDMDNPNCNWGNACQKLFKPKGVEGQCNNHYKTVETLNRLLTSQFGESEPIFDTLFLGVGDDGHTASLFPGSSSVDDMSSTTLATVSPKGVKERVTLGAKVIVNAKEVITVLTGEGKASCIEWLISRDLSKPFVSILSRRGESTLYIDRELYSLFEKSL